MTDGHRGTDRSPPPPARGGDTPDAGEAAQTLDAGEAAQTLDTGKSAQTLDGRKAALRAEAKARRDRIAGTVASDAVGRAVRDRVLAAIEFPAGCPVSAYWPMGGELDTRPLLHALHDAGHAVGLPVIVARGEPLLFRAWRPDLAMVPGGFGTQAPGPARAEVRPAVLLVPLLAFDRAGYRLGYGGGFYDRTLAALRAAGPVRAVGVAHAGQEVSRVPRDDRDQRLDWIVTDTETIGIL